MPCFVRSGTVLGTDAAFFIRPVEKTERKPGEATVSLPAAFLNERHGLDKGDAQLIADRKAEEQKLLTTHPVRISAHHRVKQHLIGHRLLAQLSKVLKVSAGLG
jgi:hypothetical protein